MPDNQDLAPTQEQTSQAMSLEEARFLIREKFKLIVDETDPVMIGVVLHQGFVADYEEMLSRHEKRFVEAVSNVSKESAAQVNKSLEILKNEALKGSLENVLAGVAEKAKTTEQLHQKILSFKRVLIFLTTLVWAAVAALFFILK